jgi:hypothetical protein
VPSSDNKYVVGMGEKNDPKRLELQTRKGWNIPNSPFLQRSPAEMKEAFRIQKGAHPSLNVRSMRSHYDCVGLVFGSRRTVIDIDHVRRILEDDEYATIPRWKAARGDLALYEDSSGPAHIGIIWGIDTILNELMVLSQWGQDGEFFHSIDDVREDWRYSISIWTDRLTFR